MASVAASAAEGTLPAEGRRHTINAGRQEPWRGVSLGGWLLLEPGPAKDLFHRFRNVDGEEATCEWELMENMRRENAVDALERHRESYMSLQDFRKIKGMGLNAVRLPFGYWVVLGSLRASPGRRHEDPYLGPGLEYLDRAVAWAEECGLQVLLDLHACPGGESAEAPCGRRQRPLGAWHWRHWRFDETLHALRVVAERYRDSSAVTGISVCNEPAPEVPLSVLCRYYDRAVELVRGAGMGPRVAVVLPVFQRSVDEFTGAWWSRTSGRHENVCFEMHWYHCFENEWHGRTFAQHLRAVEEHAEELKRYPMVVGEWSLALGRGAQPGRVSREEMCALFGRAQLAAYRQASHGWFFWNWRDANGIEWDWQQSHEAGYLPVDAAPQQSGLPPPHTPGACKEDPLEKVFDAPPADPRVRLGDTVYLRAFNGRYVDVEGPHVRARYGDRGKWQQFTLCPVSGHPIAPVRTHASGLRDGDVVSLLAHTGRYLGVVDHVVTADWTTVEEPCAFVLRTDGAADVRHRSVVFMQSAMTSDVLAPNESDAQDRDAVVARWQNLGHWQRFVIEKPLCTAVTPHRPRRRSSFPGTVTGVPAPGTPPLRRQSGAGLTEQKPSAVQRCASGLELLAQILLTPSRRRSSIGGAEEQGPQATAVTPRQQPLSSGRGLLRRRSTGGSEEAGSLPQQAVATPRRGRSSVGAEAAEAWAGSLPQPATTPRRRRSSAGAEAAEAWLAQVTLTPVQRRIGSAAEGSQTQPAAEPSTAEEDTLQVAVAAADDDDAATIPLAMPVNADAVDVKESQLNARLQDIWLRLQKSEAEKAAMAAELAELRSKQQAAPAADADAMDVNEPTATPGDADEMDLKDPSANRKRRISVGSDHLRDVPTPTRRRCSRHSLGGCSVGAASPCASP